MATDDTERTFPGRVVPIDDPGDAQTSPGLAPHPKAVSNVDHPTDSRAVEVKSRLAGVQSLLSAALDGKLDTALAIDGSLRLLAHAEDFLPKGAA